MSGKASLMKVMKMSVCSSANAGMDLKSLQYLMGDSDAGVTMNV